MSRGSKSKVQALAGAGTVDVIVQVDSARYIPVSSLKSRLRPTLARQAKSRSRHQLSTTRSAITK